MVKQEMARVNVDILGISKLRWTGMAELSSDDHYIYYCGQESLRRNGVAIIANRRAQNTVLGCNLKNDTMISVHFQGKPFNIMVIQVYAPTTSRLYIVTLLIYLICRVHHEKCWAGRSTRWNQDCQEKYQ